MTDSIRILIADDHAIVREGLRALIQTEAGMQLVGEAADGEAAVEQYRILKPDVLLLDLLMPRKDGIAALQEIKQFDPHARVIILTSFAEDQKVFSTIKAGAQGYLLKDTSPLDLLQAIRTVSQGDSYLHPAIARKVIHELSRPTEDKQEKTLLSERELEVLELLSEGISNQEIADRLVLSERTVRNHVGSILAKLGVENRTQAVLYAFRHGLNKQTDSPD